MEIAFGILLGLSVFVGWPVGGWLLGGVYAPRRAWPACPRCEYDMTVMHRDDPCPECGLTHGEALRCLPARMQPYRSWWFIVPTLIVVLTLLFFGGFVFASLTALSCVLPLAYLAYIVIMSSMVARLTREDRSTLTACWIGVILMMVYGVLAYLLESAVQGRQLAFAFDSMLVLATVAVALIPMGGIPLLLAAVLIHRRWLLQTHQALSAAQSASRIAE